MSVGQRPPIPYGTTPDYPLYAEAETYAEDFRTGAEGAYISNESWAKYWKSSYLDILTTQLQAQVYTVVALPPSGFEVAHASDIEDYEHFRGWILEYDPEAESWAILVSSQVVGIEAFKQARRDYKGS